MIGPHKPVPIWLIALVFARYEIYKLNIDWSAPFTRQRRTLGAEYRFAGLIFCTRSENMSGEFVTEFRR